MYMYLILDDVIPLAAYTGSYTGMIQQCVVKWEVPWWKSLIYNKKIVRGASKKLDIHVHVYVSLNTYMYMILI